MNFISHIHIAERALDRSTDSESPAPPHTGSASEIRPRPDPAATRRVLFGSALPDLASIGRFTLTRRPTDRWLALGVEAHHRTDDAFHNHPWFTKNSGELRAAVETLGRGPARAIGHVGIELLLDGELIERLPALGITTDAVLSMADTRQLTMAELVAPEHRASWNHHLSRIADWRLTPDHHQPSVVAERLYRVLSRRPRLAFGSQHLPKVSEALIRQRDAMDRGIDLMVSDVVTRVSGELSR